MKKYLLVIVLAIACGITACAAQKKSSKKKKATKPEISSITLMRGPCFGRCPSYTLRVSADGAAQYEGRTFSPFPGIYKKQFTPAQVAPLFKAFADYRVDTCKGNYDVTIADLPGLDYEFVINKAPKTINNARFGSDFFVKMAKQMDDTLPMDNTWQKTGELAPE